MMCFMVSVLVDTCMSRVLSAVSDPAGVPRCDLLDQPRITVGIVEGEERPIARALGVGAGEPCLRGERRAVPHLTPVDATAAELVMGRFHVGCNHARRPRATPLPTYSSPNC